MWSWKGGLWRSDPSEPPARVFTEEEEMQEVVYQITSSSRSKISVHLLGLWPIPIDQLEPYLSVLGSFNDEESLGNTHGAGGENARISD
jgi:hypothetical protein